MDAAVSDAKIRLLSAVPTSSDIKTMFPTPAGHGEKLLVAPALRETSPHGAAVGSEFGPKATEKGSKTNPA
jgi:hypothetical protein